MTKLALAAFTLFITALAAQAQRWVPSTDSTACGKISATTTAYFDTIATYAEGKVIDSKTKRPVNKATIQVAYYDCHSIVLRTRAVVSDDSGLFKLSWIGCYAARLIAVEAHGYCTIRTGKVRMGGKSELMVELMPLAVEDKQRSNPKSSN